ncbi:3-oxoacyl-ACP synthase [Microbacterium sp. Root61]|uniref:SDR family NAD(P)-dependent oxidoreductase n=1 Tax=Microbacterium sp. Root61 TaxID=1736570 RepID=UPI0006F5C590|nr:SDR family NAD(P)-dependent oxidoreductase [Microbacterium sp. Root61]KRA24707.1 3-oxoacyl-ACP synthase [Microbacterium sp. Root61]
MSQSATSDFTGDVVAVTGAAQGIGRSVAEAFGAQGARVAVIDLQLDAAQVVADAITAAGGHAIAVACDVGDHAAVDAAAAEIADRLGPISVLVSNAGITRPAMIRKMTDDEWHQVVNVHLNASFYWLKAVVEGMIARGGGRMIFTTSSTAQNGSIGQVNYAAAKSGVVGLVRTAARELGRYNILVNAVAPAAVTDMTRKVMTDPKFGADPSKTILGRFAEPDELAPTYLYLASPASSLVTGQIVSIDGGGMFVR